YDVLAPDEANPSHYNKLHKYAEAQYSKYKMEREYYRNNPQPIRDAATKYQSLLTCGKRLRTCQIVAKSGVLSGDGAFSNDIVSDVLGVLTARGVKQLVKCFADDQALARYTNDAKNNNVRIQAMADLICEATQPTSELRGFDTETPQLDCIVALKT